VLPADPTRAGAGTSLSLIRRRARDAPRPSRLAGPAARATDDAAVRPTGTCRGLLSTSGRPARRLPLRLGLFFVRADDATQTSRRSRPVPRRRDVWPSCRTRPCACRRARTTSSRRTRIARARSGSCPTARAGSSR
jgi:hypothetical protein